ALSKLIKPDIGIITNIGEAHIENFKNLKEIAKAKSEIIENIKEGGILILNRDDNFFDYISKIAKKKNLRVLSFSLFKDASSKILKITNKKNFSNITIKIFNQKYSLKIEKYNDLKAYNILASLLVAKVLNLNISKINFNSNIFDSVTGRGKVHLISRFKKKFNLVDESYNANPSSTKKAILNFSKINNKNYKKYFLFGDMLELGTKSGIYHKKLSKDINQSSIDKLFIYGKNTFKTYQETNKEKRGNILQNLSDFDEVFSKILNNNDYLMIKGSNATGLNKLTNSLIRGDRNAL
ncbi:MAG: Mur ligase family protein, partial [Pelagibacteraceae bacterium]